MIKNSIKILLGESHDRMMGYVGMQGFYYSQLCVKHEAASLLPLEVQYLGTEYKFEEVARVMYGEGEENDDKMYIYPNSNEYLQPLMESIYMVHPEFKMEILSDDDEDSEETGGKDGESAIPAFGSEGNSDKGEENDEAVDSDKYYYLLLTMPPVTKEQRKVYMDSVDAVYKYVMGKIDAENVRLEANMKIKTAGYTKEDADECKAAAKKIYEKDKGFADQLKEEKEKEIEDAYQRYLKEHPEASDKADGDGEGKKQPVMPEADAPKAPTPPKMPKAPQLPGNPLEGLGF